MFVQFASNIALIFLMWFFTWFSFLVAFTINQKRINYTCPDISTTFCRKVSYLFASCVMFRWKLFRSVQISLFLSRRLSRLVSNCGLFSRSWDRVVSRADTSLRTSVRPLVNSAVSSWRFTTSLPVSNELTWQIYNTKLNSVDSSLVNQWISVFPSGKKVVLYIVLGTFRVARLSTQNVLLDVWRFAGASNWNKSLAIPREPLFFWTSIH